MSTSSTIVHRILLPSAIGAIAALSILLWAPGWVIPQVMQPIFDTPTVINAEPQADTLRTQGPVSYADAVDIAAPAVVNIYTRKIVQRKTHPILNDPYFKRFFRNRPESSERIQSSLGSGVIMAGNGYILTNNHVIDGADEILISLRDGRDASATVVGTDPEADLAVLRIELDNIPHIRVASEHILAVGDVVLAIGNPFGVGQTVTMGIVSATGRNQLGLNTYEDYIQTDAAINPGNSGGALVNAYGELVGLNTAIFSQSGGNEGIGFAIPSEVATRSLMDIATHGTTIRGWLGIEVQEATPTLIDALGLPKELTGLIVTGIFPDGPAELAGLSAGDILVGINGKNTSDARNAMNIIAALRPGDRIDIEYIRNGETQSTRAIAGQRQQKSSKD